MQVTSGPDGFVDEPHEWAVMTPQERWAESTKLWQFYLAMGGSLDPEPDSQSPFDFEELERAVPPVRRPGLHPVRRD
jgi:hypothetical protein